MLYFAEIVPTRNGLHNPQNTLSLNLVGTAPSFAFFYVLQSDQNVVPVAAGGTVTFPATLINTNAQANFDISNTGSGAGQIKDVSLISWGTAFKLQAKPLFPIQL